MKPNETQKMKSDEMTFSAAFLVLLLMILPSLPLGKYGGGIAMVAGSIVGMIIYFAVFGKRLRERGQLRTVTLATVVSCVLGAAIAFAFPLLRGYWH